MSKKIVTTTLILLIFVSTFVILSAYSSAAISADPSKIKIFIGPNKVLADNSAYPCIFVQLQDSTGKPARAVHYTTISLTSSLTKIGTVDYQILIPPGNTYGSARFYTTYTPGTTTISASGSDYATVQATITTVGAEPLGIGIYGFPSTLPADGGSYNAIMVQLQDSSGSPAIAPQDVQVTLSCSESSVGSVPQTVTIPAGQTYTTTSFTTTTNEGQAIVTALTSEYTSKQVTIKTQTISTSSPNQIKLFVGSPKIPADKSSYKQIAVELQDSSGRIVAAPTDLTVTLTSPDETVGKIDQTITIPQSKTFILATMNTTYKPGSTTITAAATDLVANRATITTIGSTPTKLAIYCVPSSLPADNGNYNAIAVQLQDSSGRPAKNPETDVWVNLYSSEPIVGTVNTMLTIPVGKTQTNGTITVTNTPGSTTITAQASDYTTAQTTATTSSIDLSSLKTTLSADPNSILNGNTTQITATVTSGSNPITGATLKFTSDNGGTFSATKAQNPGTYTATFTAPSFSKTTNCTIIVSASKSGYLTTQVTTKVTVGPTLVGNKNGMIQFYIKGDDGSSVKDAVVSTIVQPNGMNTLVSRTNSSGYVTFNNLTTGKYTFTIIKDGYSDLNQTINITNQQLPTLTLTLASNEILDTRTLIIIIAVVVTAAVVAVVCGLLIIRRKRSAKIRKLQDLQKHLKYKY
jgi:hypothetical protein